MKKSMKVTSALLSVVLLSSTLGTNVYAEEEKPLVMQEVETDQVIVTFKEDVESEKTELDLVSVKTVDTEEIATLKVPEGETIDVFIEELEARTDIESVEPDHLVQLTYTPNDPYFNYYQYHHQNIETERAWDKTMGSSDVVVAVLDQGFDINHSDLVNQIVSPHTTADSGFSIDNHGTHVAGIIGSSIDNYTHGAGVAPKTSIMPIDVFVGETAYTSDVIEGIYQAVWAGADIINMSLGSYYYNSSYNSAIQYAYQSGLVIVAAAGNDATTRTHYPSSYENVISVGSTDSGNYQSYFSNYGTDIDIVAPGSSIYSTLPYNNFGGMSGTSMASPVVAGVAALVMANEPHLTNGQVVDRLLTTTKDLGSYGKDSLYGNGLVNAKQALKIIEIPSPRVYDIMDFSTEVWGYLPFEIESGKVIVRNQSGDVIGSSEGYTGYSYFYVAIPKQMAGTKLYVSVMDQYGNESEASEVSILDGTAPEKPAVDEVTDRSTSITGSAEANTVLTVLANDTIIDTSWVDGNGNFERPIEPMTAGTRLSLNVMDDAGNISESTDVIVKDATAPVKPTVNEVTESTVEVTGTAEAGSMVTVKARGILLGESATDENGDYSIAIAKQKAGTLLAITSTDQTGNVSEVTEVKVKDTVAPALPTVSEVTDKSTTVKGTAEASSIIIVKVAGTEIGKATANSDGIFAVTIAKQKAGTKLSVTATDAAGNVSPAKAITVLDATAPPAPIVDQVTDKSTAVTGTGEVGASISVKAGSNELGTATVAADGKYKVVISVQKVGTEIQVTATDAAGNTSAAKEVSVSDGTAPAVPTVNEVTDKSTVVNGSAEAGSTVVVKAAGTEIGKATANSNGDFAVAITKQKAGTKLSVTATDIAGNVSAAKAITVLDATAPTAPTVGKVTDNSVAVTGSGEIDALISVKADDKDLGTATVASDGKYRVNITVQKVGTKIQVTATDAAGNTSSVKEVTVTDGTAPAVPTVNEVTDKSTAVQGTAEAASQILVKIGSSELGTVTTDTDGKFSVSIPKQKAGTKIQVTATDAAGNTSTAKEVIVLDVTAPSLPIVNKVTDQSTAVDGTAEAAAQITVKAGSEEVGTATVSADGTYSIAIPKQKVGTVLSITATDKAGNVSEVKKVTVVDGAAPEVSLTSKVTHYSTRVIGASEAGSKITIKAGTKSIGTATADARGKYEVTIVRQKVGTKLAIVATDAAANSSKAIPVTVVDGNYPDLKLTHWALDEIMYLADDQIIGGYPNGGFQPEKNTTRAEAAKMLALALDLPIQDVSSGYKDVPSKHWAKDYIAAVSKAGLFNGNPDGTFAPNNVLKRAEMAKIISIAYDLDASSKNHFSDVKAGHWAKGYISGLYENGITTGFPDKTFRPGASTTRAEYSVFLARAMNEDFR